MKEATLTKLSAERATTPQLIDEINRINRALGRADTTPKQARRYSYRLVIYRTELAQRIQLESPHRTTVVPAH